jgi:hypothetical protein
MGIQNSMAHGQSTKIISLIKWIRTSRLSIKKSLSLDPAGRAHPLIEKAKSLFKTVKAIHIRQSRRYMRQSRTCKTVRDRFWPWLSGEVLQSVQVVLSWLGNGIALSSDADSPLVARGAP